MRVHVHLCVQVFLQEVASGSLSSLTHSDGGILSSAVKRSILKIPPKDKEGPSPTPTSTKAFSWKLWGGREQVPTSLRVQLGRWKTES